MLELLPLDLLALPFALVLLSVMPQGYAVATLWLLLLPLVGWLYRAGRIASRWAGFVRLAVVSALFVLLRETLVPTSGYYLRGQALWLSCFVVGSMGYYLYLRLRGEEHPPRGECACSQRREQVLRAEYRRFDSILVVFASLMALLAWPVQYLICCEPWLDRLMAYIGAGLAFAVIALELVHLRWVEHRLREEVWITQLDAEGRPSSCVPISQWQSAEGRLPLVRLIAYSSGMVYLERVRCLIMERELLDTPFCSWVHMGLTPDAVAQLLIDQRFCGVQRATPRHLLTHHAEVGGVSLQIYLYAVDVQSPELLLGKTNPREGKWWPMEQVTPLAGTSDFGVWLAEELPLLEQTALLAQQLSRQG